MPRHSRLASQDPNKPVLPDCQKQFQHVRRYWDPRMKKSTAKILPGEYYVTVEDEIIDTVLGSCVSACIRDPLARIGGMNHFMLPANGSEGMSTDSWASSDAARYGNVAMERLINDMLKLGARKERLELKLVGGGHVLRAGGGDVGERNVEFVREFVKIEHLNVLGEDLGGFHPRRVVFIAQEGVVRVKHLKQKANDETIAEERNYVQKIEAEPDTGSVELF